MKRTIFLLAGAILSQSLAFGEPVRYKDRMFEVDKKQDIAVAQNIPTLSGKTTSISEALSTLTKSKANLFKKNGSISFTEKDLLVDLYEPKDDNESSRPMVIVAHGGFFISGSKDDYSEKTIAYCDSLAARGFVVAALDYRLGTVATVKTLLIKSTEQIDSVDFAQSVYRSVQDMNTTIRYFRANASEYKINPNKIYVMGNSAGGIIALENIYAEDKDFPEWMDLASLGKIDNFGEPGDGAANGAVALWGAIHDTSMLSNKKTPVFLAHGGEDDLILFREGKAVSQIYEKVCDYINASHPENAYLSHPEYAYLTQLVSFSVETPTFYGSAVIDSLLKLQNIDHEFFYAKEAGHEFYNDDTYEQPLREAIFEFLYKLASDTYTTTDEKASVSDESKKDEKTEIADAADAEKVDEKADEKVGVTNDDKANVSDESKKDEKTEVADAADAEKVDEKADEKVGEANDDKANVSDESKKDEKTEVADAADAEKVDEKADEKVGEANDEKANVSDESKKDEKTEVAQNDTKKSNDKKAKENKKLSENSLSNSYITLAKASAVHMDIQNKNFVVTRGTDVRYAIYNAQGFRQMTGQASIGETVDLSNLKVGVYVLFVKGNRPVQFSINK